MQCPVDNKLQLITLLSVRWQRRYGKMGFHTAFDVYTKDDFFEEVFAVSRTS